VTVLVTAAGPRSRAPIRTPRLVFPRTTSYCQFSVRDSGREEFPGAAFARSEAGMGARLLVNYFKITRSRIILACFLMSAFVLSAFPEVDIGISRAFFDQGFPSKDLWVHKLIHGGMAYFLGVSMAAVVAMYTFNRSCNRNLCGVDGRKLCYLFLVLILGAGLIVNVVFKDSFGRARPRDIAEFGGSKQFTAAFVVATECDRNCSFSSGEGAGAFFSLALACALSRRREMLLAAVGLGVLVSWSRVASGAHFFSDTVVSFFVMLIVSDVLYYYMVAPGAERYGPSVELAPEAAASMQTVRVAIER
jgi:lipid A 4'-phosphatase